MARIQTLILPTAAEHDAPFVLIIDQMDMATLDKWDRPEAMDRLVNQTGARGVLVFPGTVDVV